MNNLNLSIDSSSLSRDEINELESAFSNISGALISPSQTGSINISLNSQSLFRILRGNFNDDQSTTPSITDVESPRVFRRASLNFPSPLVFNASAVINIAGDFVPDELLLVASLGGKFVPPIKFDKERVLLDLTKLGANTSSNSKTQNNSNSIPLLNKLSSSVQNYNQEPFNNTQKHILNIFSIAKNFLKNNPNVCVSAADKGNISVIYDKRFYEAKMKEHLSNSSIYQVVSVSSHLGLIKRNHSLLKRLSDIGYLGNDKVIYIVAQETQIPMIYGVWKTHKNFSLRPIISSIKAVGTRLFEVVVDILNRMDKGNPYSLSNTAQLTSELRDLKLKPDDRLFSIDIVSMFTNIQPELALSVILTRLCLFTNLSPELFREIFFFITKIATEFIFDGKHYKQISGLPMGTKGSPIIASIVLTHILDFILPNHGPITYLKKYVDDTIFITNKSNAMAVLNSLNSFNPQIKFTMEEESSEGCINFLDVSVYRDQNLGLFSKWFCKPYSSNRLVNWYSEHEPHTIRNTAVRYISNMLFYSDPSFHNEIRDRARLIMFLNSFPKSRIEDFIIQAMEIVAFNMVGENDAENTQFLSTLAPYPLLKAINKHCLEFGTNIKFVDTFSKQNNSSTIFAQLKDSPDIQHITNAVFRITCKGCKFYRLVPIIIPLVLYKALNVSNLFHPFNTMNQHITNSKHIGFKTHVELRCNSVRETLRHTEHLCRKFNIPIPGNAQNQINKNLIQHL